MAQGYLAIVLHAHLPFVRHPEHEDFLEERWLYEAITETYIPILQAMQNLLRDGIDFRLTMSFSPPLTAMLRDPLLMGRYAAFLDRTIELAHREVERTQHEPTFRRLAEMYRDRISSARDLFRRYDGNILTGFLEVQHAGMLELITCTATHLFFPLADRNWAAMRAQVQIAADHHEAHFGQRPPGMWLAECGYVRGAEELLREAGIRYFFVDTHGLLFAEPRPVYGIYAPTYCPTGVAAFARDPESSKQVWSAQEGYPGDPVYRDFYRDVGFDLPMDYIGPYIHADGIRIQTGLKYYRITGRNSEHKEPYDAELAMSRAAEHAGNFLFNRERQVEHLAGRMDRKPIIVAPYDAELFGHWWYEGPHFLEMLFRKMQYDQATVAPVLPSEYLAEYPTNQVARPTTSSWGYKGYGEVWLDGSNHWIYPHLHKLAERMTKLAMTYPSADGLLRRALNQAARELLLAQASDWAFIMKTGTSVEYAKRRTGDHVCCFNDLDAAITSGAINESWLAQVEFRDNLFPHVDYRVYAT
jgi:1,4-alpha-glucan branching enzyme